MNTTARGSAGLTAASRGVEVHGALLSAAATLAGAAIAVLVLFYAQSPTRTTTDSAPFNEYGAFDYAAVLGRNVYDGNELRAPQPLFRRLGERLPVEYRYELAGPPGGPLEGAHGRYSMMAEVRQTNGWARSLPLITDAEFSGAQLIGRGVIDVAALADLIRQLEAETGYKSPTFRVRVIAHVEFSALLAGQPLDRVHDQVLDFALSEVEMRLDREASVVTHHAPGAVTFPVERPRMLTVPMAGFAIPHAQLPAISLGGFIAAIAMAIAALVTPIWLRRSQSPEELSDRHRGRVVDIFGAPVPPGGGGRTAEVASIDSLFRLAEDYQLPVLRSTGPPVTYWVLADTSYVHVAAASTTEATPWRAPPQPAGTVASATNDRSTEPVERAVSASDSPSVLRTGGLGDPGAGRARTDWTALGATAGAEAASAEVGSLGWRAPVRAGLTRTEPTPSPDTSRPADAPAPVEAEAEAISPATSTTAEAPPRRTRARPRAYWGDVVRDDPAPDEQVAA